MKNKKEVIAGLIIIGNEILSGRTQDTNTSTLSKWLNSLGIKVEEVRIIPDNEKIIISTVDEFKKMIAISQDKEFHCHTCIYSTARCNRMALEINSEWNKVRSISLISYPDEKYVSTISWITSLPSSVTSSDPKNWNRRVAIKLAVDSCLTMIDIISSPLKFPVSPKNVFKPSS